MKKTILYIFISIVFVLLGTTISFAQQTSQAISLSIFPVEIRQGDPMLVAIDGITDISLIKKFTFNEKSLNVFVYQDKLSALVGIDLNKKVGNYELKLELANGEILKKDVSIEKRDKTEAPLGIPKKLGGNTKASQDKLVATLNADNKILGNIYTSPKALWKEKFILPLEEIFVTSPYGNSRKTGEYSIPHKGTDYRAKIGTEIIAPNRGIVRIAQTFRNHGKTLVIDHGMGVMTFYLHMSKFKVKPGDVIERGQIVGLTGATGYTMGPHLHLGVRINNISIDPEKFFELFK